MDVFDLLVQFDYLNSLSSELVSLPNPNSFKIINISTLQASAAVRTLATVKPHVPLIKVSEIVNHPELDISEC